MFIIQITTCVNYADYLAVTLPNNQPQIDVAFIVTDWNDMETSVVTGRISHVGLVRTSVFYENRTDFNKGAGINSGIHAALVACRNLSEDIWFLHMDADILLPANFKEFISSYPLDKDSLYGCPRMICPSSAAWKAMKASGGWGNPAWERQNVGLEARHRAGKAGYFQLWNAGAACLGGLDGMPWYPESSPHAGKSDGLFMRKFPEDKRHELPIEVIELHQNYQKTDPRCGPNWSGRTTPRFEGE